MTHEIHAIPRPVPRRNAVSLFLFLYGSSCLIRSENCNVILQIADQSASRMRKLPEPKINKSLWSQV